MSAYKGTTIWHHWNDNLM